MRKKYVVNIYTAGSEQLVHLNTGDIQSSLMDKFPDYFVDVHEEKGKEGS